MRKRFLAALITGAMIVGGLTGCGNQSTASNEQSSAYNSSATTSGYVDENGAHAGDDGTFANVGGGGSSQSSEPSADASNDPAEVSSSDENLEQSESESNSEEATQSTGRPSVRPQAEEVSLDNLHGIIAAYIYWEEPNSQDIPMAQIFAIDDITGEAVLINDFGRVGSTSSLFFDVAYSMPIYGHTEYGSTTYRRCFSDDFQRFAVNCTTKVSSEYNGDSYAGWLDKDGNFFNVITTLGWESKSSFDSAVYYWSIGFMDDGRFLFAYSEDNRHVYKYYAVPVDNVTEETVEELETNPFLTPNILSNQTSTTGIILSNSIHAVTDQVDETHFLINNYQSKHGVTLTSVALFDIETEETTYCVPGDGMDTWNGILDPTGTKLAFFAAKPNTGSTMGLYIMPFDASVEPSELTTTNYKLYYPRNFEGGFERRSPYCTLLDWR